jgi:hypothetical protein
MRKWQASTQRWRRLLLPCSTHPLRGNSATINPAVAERCCLVGFRSSAVAVEVREVPDWVCVVVQPVEPVRRETQDQERGCVFSE